MCLAIPGKIVEIDKKKEHATIDYGDGTKRKANITLVEIKIGDYVLVSFIEEMPNETERNIAIVTDKVYKSW